MSAHREISSGSGEMPSRIADGSSGASRVIVLQGDLDLDTTPRLREQLNALIESGVFLIVLDCANLDYVDSTGLGVLISALKQTANRDGALALARPTERVSRILRVTGMSALFPVYAGVEEACAAIGAQAAV